MRNSSNPDELFIRLYLDRHIKLRLADDLRERGFDVLTTGQATMDTASDEQQLAFATEQDRAILTFNIRDFAPLHKQWLATGRNHAGIVVSQQLGSRQYGALLSRTVRLLETMTGEELRNNLVHLEQFRTEASDEG
jgi:predicted nuclease of predicted toxin-antitoxin system